jgi:twitching motility protein PilT
MSEKELNIDDLLRFMVEQKASDLHIKPMRPPLMRLNGRLLPLKSDPLSPDMIPRMLEQILTEKQRQTLDEQQAVDFGYSVGGLSRFRASVFQQRGTRCCVFRRVPFDFPSLEDWGMPPVISEFSKLQQGLVLITGPTGSGKSSTLASLTRLVAQTRLCHIVTIEDPIEFLLSDDKASVTQREVGCDTPSFGTALRNVLRQDPDVIVVGEMRDTATMQTAMTAAETGHLVFSTLHTNSASQTVDRLIDSFPAGNHNQIRQQLAHVLQAVVSLKLVERKDGQGLVSAVEILRRTPRTSKLIEQGNLEALEEEIEKSVSYHKMQTMNQSLAALVLHKVIEYDKAMATSSNSGDLDLMLRRFLYASQDAASEEDDMAQPVSDFSKILELQEIKKAYEEVQERHQIELQDRDSEIQQLRAQLEEQAPAQSGTGEIDNLTAENDRLTKQSGRLKQEYDAKIERLNSRIREASAAGRGGGRGRGRGRRRAGCRRRLT